MITPIKLRKLIREALESRMSDSYKLSKLQAITSAAKVLNSELANWEQEMGEPLITHHEIMEGSTYIDIVADLIQLIDGDGGLVYSIESNMDEM